MTRTRYLTVLAVLLTATTAARGDGLMFHYEGDILPGDPGSDLDIGNPCEPDCSRRLADGHFILEWGVMGDFTMNSKPVNAPPVPAPSTFWVEWRFRSNQDRPPSFSGCDGFVKIQVAGILEIVEIFQDAVRDNEGSDFVNGLAPGVFRTYRFETLDGDNYTLSVDGVIFNVEFDGGPDGGYSFVQFGGDGGCAGFRPQPVRNEWDFIRYGTIETGELVTAVDPPPGNITAPQGVPLRSFTITFDQPAYLYVDDISVSVTGGVAPTVVATRRLDNGPSHVLAVFIDGGLPIGQTTTFTFDTGTGPQSIAYTRLPSDIPASSTWGLIVFALGAAIAGSLIFRKRTARFS